MGFDVVSNRPKVAAYRAPGAPIGALLGRVRARRAGREARDGSARAPPEERGQAGHQGGARPGLSGASATRRRCSQALAIAHYKAPLRPNQGRGVASGFWFNAGGEFERPGQHQRGRHRRGDDRPSRHRRLARLDGQHRRRAAGHRLPARCSVLIGDTSSVGFSNLTGGSRVTFASAMVVTQAAEKVIKQLRERAAKIWKIDRGGRHLGQRRRHARPATTPASSSRCRWPQLAAKATRDRRPDRRRRRSSTPPAPRAASRRTSADVEVDPRHRQGQGHPLHRFQDVGRAIHPDYVEGQIQGGVAQGIGWALNEEYIYNKHGQLDNPGFLDYRMPVASDLPMIECGHHRGPQPQASAGRARRRRGAARAGHGGGRATPSTTRIGIRFDRPADVAAQGAGGAGARGAVGESGRLTLA